MIFAVTIIGIGISTLVGGFAALKRCVFDSGMYEVSLKIMPHRFYREVALPVISGIFLVIAGCLCIASQRETV